MATGTVKFFNSQKGFGFIQPQDGGQDVFVHISAVERAGMSNLNEGQKLTYDVVSERGKLAASKSAERLTTSNRDSRTADEARPRAPGLLHLPAMESPPGLARKSAGPQVSVPLSISELMETEDGTQTGDASGICPVRRLLRRRLAALQSQGAERHPGRPRWRCTGARRDRGAGPADRRKSGTPALAVKSLRRSGGR